MPNPAKPKTRVNRLTTPDGTGDILAERPIVFVNPAHNNLAVDAAARTGADYLRHVDYHGADPTGVEDSTAAFAAAIAAAGSAPIILGVGTYLLPTGVPNFSNPGGIIGQGQRASKIKVTTTTGRGIGVSDSFGGGIYYGPASFSGFTLQGPGATGNTNTGIKWRRSDGDFMVGSLFLTDMRVVGFETGIHTENCPQQNFKSIVVDICRVGFKLVKPDTFFVDGIGMNGRINNGNDPAVLAYSGSDCCSAFEITASASPLPGAGWSGVIENFEIGDVDRVLLIDGSTPVAMRNGNFERIGTENQPETGADYVIKVYESLSAYHFEGFRIGGTAVGTLGSSALVWVDGSGGGAAPRVTINRMRQAGIGAGYVFALVTGSNRGYIVPLSDYPNSLRYAATLGAAADANTRTTMPPAYVATTSEVGPIELATDAETQTGTDAVRAVAPSSLAAWWTWVKGQAITLTGLFSASNVAITGGTISGITDLAIADGGTGASTAAGAFSNIKQAATTSASGAVELPTLAEVVAGVDTERAVTPDTLIGALISPKLVVMREEFFGGLLGSIVGELSWQKYTKQGTLSFLISQNSYPHLGNLKLTTSSVLGDGGSVSLDLGADTGNTFPGIENAGWECFWVLALNQTTDTITRIGLINTPNVAYNAVTNRGLYLRYDTRLSDANWQYVSCVGGTETVTDSGVAASTSWITARIRMTTAGHALFSINGGAETDVTTAISGSVSPRALLYTNTTASKDLLLDFFSIKYTGLAR